LTKILQATNNRAPNVLGNDDRRVDVTVLLPPFIQKRKSLIVGRYYVGILKQKRSALRQ
jgi:hypothetical protein